MERLLKIIALINARDFWVLGAMAVRLSYADLAYVLRWFNQNRYFDLERGLRDAINHQCKLGHVNGVRLKDIPVEIPGAFEQHVATMLSVDCSINDAIELLRHLTEEEYGKLKHLLAYDFGPKSGRSCQLLVAFDVHSQKALIHA